MDVVEVTDALFLSATEGILVTNERGEIIRINPSAERLFGYERNELIGREIEVLVPRRYISEHKKYRKTFNNTPVNRSFGERAGLYGLRKNGTEFPVEISLSPFSTDSEKFVIAFLVDITYRKEAEEILRQHSEDLQEQVKSRTLILEEAVEQLQKTKQDLNNALKKERELNRLKSRFVSIASHEFRTPLATILSSLALVKKYGELDEHTKQEKHIERIKSSVANLTDILDDFLSLSKLEEGAVENIPGSFNIQQFIESVVEEMQLLAKENQTIRYRHNGGSDVKLDSKILKTVLFNLVSNALKFSGCGQTVELSSEVSRTSFRIVVRDEGIGIPREEHTHIFERFFRAQNAMHIKGTGLGLNIVASLVEVMHGNIELSSIENMGTTVTLTFAQ